MDRVGAVLLPLSCLGGAGLVVLAVVYALVLPRLTSMRKTKAS